MALPAHLLERLPASIGRGEPRAVAPAVSLGSELDGVLPDGGLPRNRVIELSVKGGLGLGTSIGLLACRSVQKEAALRGGDTPWCAFVDPSGTLYAPGVAFAGVRLDRLLVVRPRRDALERTAIRLVESQAFEVLVVDALGVPGARVNAPLGQWPRVVRRLALAAESSGSVVLLVTDGEACRPLPLPVAMRLEIERTGIDRISVQLVKDQRGRVGGPRTVAWARPRAEGFAVHPAPPRKSEMPALRIA